MPRVTVVIPTYNRCDLVCEALASVTAQSYLEVEVIVIDDGSDDGTAEVVQQFAEVQYVYQSNRGVSAARNAGVARAHGELIAFLDSDDLWHPQKLARQVALFDQHPDVHICHTDEIWIRDGVRVNPHHKHRKTGGDIFARSLELCLVSPSAVLMRKALFERLGGFDESLPACEDYDLWLRISAHWPVHFIAMPLVIKRGGHADQLSRRFWGMDRFRVQSLCKLIESGVLSQDQYRLTVEMLRKKCSILAHGAQKRGQDGEPYLTLRSRYDEKEVTLVSAQ
jgi:glycosyltransferase involved in cell wall biosynthesis